MAKQSVEVPKSIDKKTVYTAVIIVVLAFISFLPALRNNFIPTWDDDKYVTNDPVIRHLDGASLREMFTRPVNGAYVPLPILTYTIEYQLFQDKPLPYHCTNLILHILSALLVFLILRLLKIDLIYAAFGALLFAIHPMRVESVAWISERKDVLYAFFYLASVYTYLRHISTEGREKLFLGLTYVFFILALFSKIEAVTLPLGLLLIDYYLQRPLKWKLVTEKIPFFLLSLLFGAIGIVIIYRVGLKTEGFLQANEMIGLGDRIFYALYTVSGYLVKFIAPVHLSAYYPYPEFSGMGKIFFYAINPLLLCVPGFFIYRSAKRTRTFVFGTLFFLVNIFFLLQIFAVGVAFFADRYTYIPYFGLFFIVAWSAQQIVKKKEKVKNTVITLLSVYCIACIFLTYNRCSVWKDGESLWTDVIEKYPDRKVLPYANRGVAYTEQGKWDEAVADFTKALSIDPKSPAVYSNRGFVYGNMGQPGKAIADFSRAVELDPNRAMSYFNRGVTYGNAGEPDKAIADFKKAIGINPKYIQAYISMGLIYFQINDFDNAIATNQEGLKIDPQNARLYCSTANCYLEKGDDYRAIRNFKNCLAIDETNADACFGMAVACYMKNDRQAANGYLAQAIQIAQKQNPGLNSIDDLSKAGYMMGPRKRDILVKMTSETH